MVDWKKEVKLSDLVRRKAGDEPAVEQQVAPPPLPPAPAAQPEPEAPAPVVPAAEQPLPAAVPPVAATPPVVSPSIPEPPPGIHPPVPAEELDPPDAPTASFLKKEISFRRKPKQPKEPKRPQEPGGEKRSFLKLELSLKRKPKQPKETSLGGEPKQKPAGRRRQSVQKRHKKLVGLKVGASQLAAARVVNNGGPELVQVARDELDQGVVVGGELREPDALADALKAFFRANKLPRQAVRLGIANNRIGVRIFEIGGIDDPRQLENAIRFRAQEALPIPIEEAVLDYHTLEEIDEGEGPPKRRILLVVAYRELIDRYVAACRKAGLKLVGIDLEAFALLRALGEPPEHASSDAALVVVSIGHDRSTFAVSDGRVCEFTRVLDWGGSTLNVALARALDIAPSEAEPIKRALSLAPHATPTEGLTEEQDAKAREAVRRQLQSFARELVSSLQFYQNQPGSLGIGEIVLTGGTAHLDGLAEELHRLIGVQVRIGDPLLRVKVGKKVTEPEQLGSLTVAIGLGIED